MPGKECLTYTASIDAKKAIRELKAANAMAERLERKIAVIRKELAKIKVAFKRVK